MSLLPGLDYPTQVVVGPITITDGQLSPAVLFTVPYASYPNAIVEYSIKRGTITEVGSFQVSTNGTEVSLSTENTGTNLTGVSISPGISGSNLEVLYTSTSTGQAAQFWYTVRNITN